MIGTALNFRKTSNIFWAPAPRGGRRSGCFGGRIADLNPDMAGCRVEDALFAPDIPPPRKPRSRSPRHPGTGSRTPSHSGLWRGDRTWSTPVALQARRVFVTRDGWRDRTWRRSGVRPGRGTHRSRGRRRRGKARRSRSARPPRADSPIHRTCTASVTCCIGKTPSASGPSRLHTPGPPSTIKPPA